MPTKRCVKCGIEKDIEEFAWRNRLLGIRQKACRSCRAEENRGWYERHGEEHRENVARYTSNRREEAERFIYEYLSKQRCTDCGEYDFSVLEFDHVPERGKKLKSISRMVADGESIDAIRKEISKCDVVCTNCHRRREQKRRGSARFEKYWPKWPEDYEKWRDEDEDS